LGKRPSVAERLYPPPRGGQSEEGGRCKKRSLIAKYSHRKGQPHSRIACGSADEGWKGGRRFAGLDSAKNLTVNWAAGVLLGQRSEKKEW